MPRSSIDPWTRASAKRMRREPTEVERRRRQAPIGPYVADFAWLSARLVIELDGGQHAQETVARDLTRDGWLGERGFRVLRFWNSDVIESLDGVVEAILRECRDMADRPLPTRPAGGPPSPRGGGGPGGGVAAMD